MSGGGSGKNGADANILNGENARRDEWGTDTDGERISLPLSRMAQDVVGRSGISGGHPFETPIFSLN